jgi:hypothetical protein
MSTDPLIALNEDLKFQLDSWKEAHAVMHKAHAELEQRQARFIAAARAYHAWIIALRHEGDDLQTFDDFLRLMDAASEGFDD